MKILLILFLIGAGNVYAQNERHKKLIEQIVALKVHFNHVDNGYRLVDLGLQRIKKIRDGDLTLHTDFIQSLNNVNPSVKNYGRASDIISLQWKLILQMRQCLQGARIAGQLTRAELNQCTVVFNNVMKESLDLLEQLIPLITDQELQMTDDERLQRIDQLFEKAQEQFAFSSSYGEQLALLSVHRLREQFDINLSKKIRE